MLILNIRPHIRGLFVSRHQGLQLCNFGYMKRLIIILSLGLPMMLMGQKSSDINKSDDKALWEGFKRRIEIAVEQGLITPEQARERYAGFRKRMEQRNDQNLGSGRMNLNRREQNTELVAHFKKLGISDLNRIKNGLLENGITDGQLDAVLGGMVRLIHGANAEKEDFEMNPRIQAYFQDRIGLNQEQILYVMDASVRIAQRVQ